MLDDMTAAARTVIRFSISLTGQDLQLLARLRQPPQALPGLTGNPSEAAAAAVVFRLGLDRLREQAAEAGYAALAAQIAEEPEEHAERATLRVRRGRVVRRP